MSKQQLHFPFAAVAAQSQFKLALLLAAINPLLGGVLVSGPRGLAKSTLAKGLADILPEVKGISPPFVNLPLGATEEMLIGSLNLQRVLEEQQVAFQAGLLAKAHGGVLYVDEVNLLPDNLVDQLLDVVASGVNTVERDGISHQHAAEFILLGTMNPDEGELRPQLADRFGLSVLLSNEYRIEERIQVVKLREEFDKNPLAFVASYKDKQQALKQKILQARDLLPQLSCNDVCRRLIAERCVRAGVDGLRADIVWTRAAQAHASLQRNNEVTENDVLAVADLVLNHRRNNDEPANKPPGHQPQQNTFSKPAQRQQPQSCAEQNGQEGDWGAMSSETQNQLLQAAPELNLLSARQSSMKAPAKVSQWFSTHKVKGCGLGPRQSPNNSSRVNWFATLVNNLPCCKLARLHFFKKKQAETIIHLVLLDTSASILKNQAFAKAKGLILQLVKKAYLKREQFALVAFGNQQVKTLVAMRRAPKAIEALLDTIEASGGTPLHAALQQAEVFQRQQLRKHPRQHFKNTLITDGRISQLPINAQLHGEVFVVDVEQTAVKRGKSRQLAELLQGQYIPLVSDI
ncbi:MAG: VWA domain-containing protein [Cellvibrionaceae bacterium]|nr:VWA domain-containing protein [Cellvibrionaceae bacterium]